MRRLVKLNQGDLLTVRPTTMTTGPTCPSPSNAKAERPQDNASLGAVTTTVLVT